MAIKNVTVVGGGVMGAGIVETAITHGFTVTLVEVNETLALKSKDFIAKRLQRAARRKFRDDPSEQATFFRDAVARLTTTTNLTESVRSADLVIEAIIENISAKLEMFAIIDKVAPAHTIFVSNTSSLLITDIAAATARHDRFAGLHFFSPVPLMRLVEIIRIAATSDATYTALKQFAVDIGKTSITCKDTPGFVVNRFLIPFAGIAMKLLDDGVATTTDIDIAMKLGAGHPMGPFELLDSVGLDTSLNIAKIWYEKDPINNPPPSETLTRLVKEGKLGVKTGEGFYNYKQ